MKHFLAWAQLVALALPCLGPAVSAGFPEHRAAAPEANPVTRQNLLASERFWPYRVSLVRSWKPAGREQPLVPGSTGVLIRVESSGRARIDFGRDGLCTVPAEATDLIERANDVRLGKLEKQAANFVLAIGPRLLDSSSDEPRSVPIAESAHRPGFLAVFAAAERLPELAPVLAPLEGRGGVMTIVFAQGDHPDLRLRDDLRRLGWKVPFVPDHLADAYTDSLLPDGMRPPAVVLQTPEGRVLFARAWGDDVGARLAAAALERELGGEPAP